VPRSEELPELGLVYQNPFVHWFNHSEDASYDGPRYQVSDGAVVVGGGLASVDVAKIINLELYRGALFERGINVSVVQLEHQGIPDTLARHGLKLDEVDVTGCTIYYRRRVRDMPLAFPRANATPEQVAKIETVREKMVGILAEKFRVKVQDCSAPIAPIIEDGKLSGLVFRKTALQGGKLQEVPGSDFEARAQLIVSSIGSVPLAIEGVPTKGELYDYASWDSGTLRGLPGVFGLGNVLTGKGNIKDSRENARQISDRVLSEYMGLTSERELDPMTSEHERARIAAEEVVQSAIRRAKVPVEKLENVVEAIRARWDATGYDGDYAAYLAKHPPAS
jgi:hypothetical protein